jgi:hypothetical protein
MSKADFLCGNKCRYYLGQSFKEEGKLLCNNPFRIIRYESCLMEPTDTCPFFRHTRYLPSDDAVNNKRKSERWLTYISCSIYEDQYKDKPESALVVDISAGGIALIMDRESAINLFKSDSPSELRIDLKTKHLDLSVLCRVCHILESSSCTQIGAEFIDTLESISLDHL